MRLIDADVLRESLGITGTVDSCKHYAGEGTYCANNICVQFDHFYCYYAERKEE